MPLLFSVVLSTFVNPINVQHEYYGAHLHLFVLSDTKLISAPHNIYAFSHLTPT